MSTSTNKTAFWSYLGQGLAWLLFAIGVGSCTWMEKQTGPLVIVKHERAP